VTISKAAAKYWLAPLHRLERMIAAGSIKGHRVMDIGESPRFIFAEVNYPGKYADVHSDIVALLTKMFPDIQSGLQGDSYIWVTDGADKVEIDTFSSMRHQVKAHAAISHLQNVIAALREKYDLQVFEDPVEAWG
jgi:hypothetical protein